MFLKSLLVRFRRIWNKSLLSKAIIILVPAVVIVTGVLLVIYFTKPNTLSVTEEIQEPQVDMKANLPIDDLLSAINPDDPDSLNNAERLVSKGPEVIPELLTRLESQNLYGKWAIIYALSRLGYDQDQQTRDGIITAVKNEFTNEAMSIRIMAAGVTTIFGDKEGIPVLIEGLKAGEQLIFSEPPELICQYSANTLEHYLGQTFGDPCSWDNIDEEVYSSWLTWWEQNGDKLKWDNENKVYTAN